MDSAGVTSSYHEPVMLREVLESLDLKPGGIYVDGTVGGGGHARGILTATAPDGILVGIDRDDEALAETGRVLEPFGKRKFLVKGDYADLEGILSRLGIGRVDGIVLDLGVSSHQLETAERGFSFTKPAPLDMRMDRDAPRTARQIVNTADARELKRILRLYGEELLAGRIARAIVERRKAGPIETTDELAGIIASAMPARMSHGRIHPATRTFPGAQDRRQRRADKPGPGHRLGNRLFKGRRAVFRHLLPLAGRPDGEGSLPRRFAGMHLPSRSSRLRLRGQTQASGHYPQAAPSRPGRGGPEPPGAQRETSNGREGLTMPIAKAARTRTAAVGRETTGLRVSTLILSLLVLVAVALVYVWSHLHNTQLKYRIAEEMTRPGQPHRGKPQAEGGDRHAEIAPADRVHRTGQAEASIP